MVQKLDTEHISQLIKSITKQDEDAFQETWLQLLEDEQAIIATARAIHRKHVWQEIRDKYTLRSLEAPAFRDSDGHDTKLSEILASPDINTQIPSKHDTAPPQECPKCGNAMTSDAGAAYCPYCGCLTYADRDHQWIAPQPVAYEEPKKVTKYCKVCRGLAILKRGLCSRCLNEYIEGKRHSIRWTWHNGEYRLCLRCGNKFYRRYSQTKFRPFKLCPSCNKELLPKLRSPIWIDKKRRSPYEPCPICGKMLLFCGHSDIQLEKRPAKK